MNFEGESNGDRLSDLLDPRDPVELDLDRFRSFSVIIGMGALGPKVTRSGCCAPEESFVSADVRFVRGVCAYFL